MIRDRAPRRGTPLHSALVHGVVALTALLTGCAMAKFVDEPTPPRVVQLSVTDEDGGAVSGATIEFGGRTVATDPSGRAELALDRSTVAIVSKGDFLTEPVAVNPDDGELAVRLWRREGGDGRIRTSVHFGGDVMLGRRYLDPELPTPFVDDERSARRVVAELGPMAAAADTTIVNLETVIGELDETLALPAKRFLIQSSPLVTSVLDELGVDLVTLGNNHAYDWGETGLASTIEALDDAGIAHVGAAHDAGDAVRGRLVDAGGVTLGVVSATTVTGDYVNDRLPPPDERAPADLAPQDAWQYEERAFGLRAATADDRNLRDTQVALNDIRVSEAWEVVEAAERHLPTADAEAAAKLVWLAFPELQDWVARRGHGGAARYDSADVENEIGRLRRTGADVVLVQLHGGYQFAPVASTFIRNASRAAIDAGADAVISHHPHVVQGLEWYRGGLIAYSLGNLVFDQDFLSTFPSMLVRVVTDGVEIVEARVLPVVLDRYRPTPLAGDAARDVVHAVAARSALAASSDRLDGKVVSVLDDADGVDLTNVRFDRNSGVIERLPGVERPMSIALRPDGTAALPACSLVRADLLGDGVEIAEELFGWGSFDRGTTDEHRQFPVGWLVPSSHERWEIVDGADDDIDDLAVELRSSPNVETNLRIAALIDVPDHRLYEATGAAVDPDASYEIRLWARRNRGEVPVLRVRSYARDDGDPTVAPRTEPVEEIDLPIDVPDDAQWHRLSVPVPDGLLQGEGAGALNLIIALPPAHLGTLAVDDVMVLEWRARTATDHPVWMPADLVRSTDETADLVVRSC